jgi:hypothetical protein
VEHFLFHSSLLRMRLDYLDDPRVSQEVAERVKREYYQFIYRQGLALGRPTDYQEGYEWLRARYPHRYGTFRHRLGARLVRLQALWRFGERVGAVHVGWRTWRALSRHRARRSALGEPLAPPSTLHAGSER